MSFGAKIAKLKDRAKRHRLDLGSQAGQGTLLSAADLGPTPQPEGESSIAASTSNTSVIGSPNDSPIPTIAQSKIGSQSKPAAWVGLKALLRSLELTSHALGPLQAAIDELSRCIDVYERVAEGRKDYHELQIKLDGLLEDLSQYLNGPVNPIMTTSMKNLCNGIQVEVRLLEQKRGRGTVRQHIEAVDDAEEMIACYRRVHGHLERLALNANLSTWKITDEQATEGRLSKLASSLAAVYNSAESEDVKRGPCTPGTRVDELNKLLVWARNGQAEDIYWLNGMAGTGKTTIAYSFCAEIDKTAELGASFFCSRSIPECRNVKLILPTIAYQIARFSRPFRCALSQVLEADPDVHTRVLKEQFENLLVRPLLEVKNALPSEFVVLIDALDECESENSVGQILDLLIPHARTSNLPIRFLISSRPEPEIYHRMMNPVGGRPDARLVLHELEKVKVERDIEIYLKEELGDMNLTSSQMTALVKRSGALFIYAATAARYIKDGLAFMEHEERLDVILGLTPSPDGNDHNIDVLYSIILSAAFRNPKLSRSTRERMKTLLDTIICAQEPMTVRSFAGLLNLKSGKQVEGLLRPLYSVVHITETSALVTTLHASFPDFMLDQQRSTEFYCDSATNHRRLAQACFETIKTNKPQFNICGLESSFKLDEDVTDLEERVDQAVSPQLFYACRYWVAHLELSERHVDLNGPLLDFLSVRLLLWMEVLNVKKSMHLGARIIQCAENWSRNHDRSDTTELAHDAWRFVTMFASHAIAHSTPHIYVSMLPFWPESAPLAAHFAGRMRGAIKPQGTAMTRRRLGLLAIWRLVDDADSAYISSNGSLIAMPTTSGIQILDGTGTTGQSIGSLLRCCENRTTSLAFSLDHTRIVVGSIDARIRVWDIQSGHTIIDLLEGHTQWVTAVDFSPDGARIVSSSYDTTIRVWDEQSGKTILGPLGGHTGPIFSTCFSPGGSRIVSGSEDMTIRIWDAQSGKSLLDPLEGHTGSVQTVTFSPNGIYIASGSSDTTIRLWDARNGQTVVEPLKGHTEGVRSVRFSLDGTRIVSGSSDRTVRVWDAQSAWAVIALLEGHTSMVFSVGFSPDGTRIISSSYDRTIRVWDAQTGKMTLGSLQGHTLPVRSVRFSPDGARIASSSGDNTICVWDTLSGQMIACLDLLVGSDDFVESVCFSPSGTRIAYCIGHSIHVWDPESDHVVVGPFQGHALEVWSFGFCPHGTRIVSGSADTTVRIWDVQTGQLVFGPLQAHDFGVSSVSFSPDGASIISCGGLDIRLWNAQNGQMLIGLPEGHTRTICSVAFSPDGTLASSGSYDNNVCVWDIHKGQIFSGPLKGHTGAVRTVEFSPDGTYIISSSDDETIRVWDVQSGQVVLVLRGHSGPVNSARVSPDGTVIASGSYDETIRVWDISDLSMLRKKGSKDPPPTFTYDSDATSPPYNDWVLEEDGWVVDTQSHPLVWVPLDLHAALLSPRNTLLISTRGSFKLDFNSAAIGESWAQCYEAPVC